MSVAKFVRGLDLNEHSLNVGLALNGVGEMVNLEWIRLDHTKLSLIPEELFKLRKLKRLTLSNNQVNTSGHAKRPDWTVIDRPSGHRAGQLCRAGKAGGAAQRDQRHPREFLQADEPAHACALAQRRNERPPLPK